MSASVVGQVHRHSRLGEPRFIPTEGKQVLGYFDVCCPMERPTGGGAACVLSEVRDLPPGTSGLYVWAAGWDCQFTEAGSSANVERLLAHVGVHAYAFRKDGTWFIQASMILANASDDTHWAGWVDLFGIAVG